MASAQRVDVQESICLLALEELHGRDLACGSEWSEGLHSIHHIGGLRRRRGLPLMILQKMHAAAMLGGGYWNGGMRDGYY
jgi:hypothetical protein